MLEPDHREPRSTRRLPRHRCSNSPALTGMAGPMAATRVLIVEDEFAVGASLGDALRRVGLESIHAADAEEALGILRRESISLVITDLRMPGSVDGFALVKWLSKIRPSLPVIVTSGYHV